MATKPPTSNGVHATDTWRMDELHTHPPVIHTKHPPFNETMIFRGEMSTFHDKSITRECFTGDGINIHPLSK